MTDDGASLYHAALEGDLAVVRLLVQSNRSLLAVRNVAGHTPLMASSTTERPDIAEVLITAGAIVTDVSPENGYTAMHWALHHPPRNRESVLSLVKHFVAAGADVNACGTNGVTPLMLASWFGSEEAAKYLLLAGADPKIRDKKGSTALSMAKQRRNEAIVNVLESVSDGALRNGPEETRI